MNTKLLLGVAAAIVIGLGGTASADTLNISNPSGSASYTDTGDVTFTNPGSAGPVSGPYFALFSSCTNCTTMTDFSETSTNFQVLSLSEGGHTDVIDLSSVTFDFNNGDNDLTVLGSGTSQIDGGVLQSIFFNFTIQGGPETADSYSGTITTTPLPPTWTMLIASLLGLGLIAYRGSRKQSVSLLGAAA